MSTMPELTHRKPSRDTTSFEDEKLEKNSTDDVTPYGDSDEPFYYDLKVRLSNPRRVVCLAAHTLRFAERTPSPRRLRRSPG